MAAPNFKNSKLRLDASINSTDRISVSFWLNIDDAELSNQIEAYYAIANKQPSIQLQRNDGNYVNVASANLFLPDEVKAKHQASNPGNTTSMGESDDHFPGA